MSSDPPIPRRVSHQDRQKWQQLFERGRRFLLVEPAQHDQAHKFFAECARCDPGNSVYVEMLLNNLQAMYGDRRRTPARWAWMMRRRSLRNAWRDRRWTESLQQGPTVLEGDPWDAETLRRLADACRELGHNDVELIYLRRALNVAPGDGELNRQVAFALGLRGAFDAAVDCWRVVLEQAPGDAEATRWLELLSQPTQAEAESASVQAVRNRLQAEAGEIGGYIELAELLIAAGAVDEGEAELHKAATISPGELRVRERLEEMDLHRKQRQIELAKTQADDLGSAAAARLVEQLHEDLNRLEIEVYDLRAQRYPDQPGRRLDLAQRLKRGGLYSQAAEVLNTIVEESEFRCQALLDLGECSQFQRRFDESLACYQSAVEAAKSRKMARLPLYRAAVLAMALERLDLARRLLEQLAADAPTFKDTAERLDKVRQMIDKL